MTITIRWADDALNRFADRILRLQQEFPKVLPQEINKVGNLAKTQVIRNLTKQTGLPRKTIVKAVGNPLQANTGRLSYEMRTKGGQVRIKYLGAKEKQGGVTARPFGQTKFYAGSFMRGGAFPNRKEVAKFDGHAWRRLNSRGTRITQVKSDVVIPTEMTKGATLAAFNRVAGPLFAQRIERVLDKLAP